MIVGITTLIVLSFALAGLLTMVLMYWPPTSMLMRLPFAPLVVYIVLVIGFGLLLAWLPDIGLSGV